MSQPVTKKSGIVQVIPGTRILGQKTLGRHQNLLMRVGLTAEPTQKDGFVFKLWTALKITHDHATHLAQRLRSALVNQKQLHEKNLILERELAFLKEMMSRKTDDFNTIKKLEQKWIERMFQQSKQIRDLTIQLNQLQQSNGTKQHSAAEVIQSQMMDLELDKKSEWLNELQVSLLRYSKLINTEKSKMKELFSTLAAQMKNPANLKNLQKQIESIEQNLKLIESQALIPIPPPPPSLSNSPAEIKISEV